MQARRSSPLVSVVSESKRLWPEWGMQHVLRRPLENGSNLENAWSLYRRERALEKRVCHMQSKKLATGRIAKSACRSTALSEAKKREHKQRNDTSNHTIRYRRGVWNVHGAAVHQAVPFSPAALPPVRRATAAPTVLLRVRF